MAGVDGTDGNHPRYTTVVNNIAREVGLYEKQSSFFVEAKTAQSIILGTERKRLLFEPFISKNDLFTKTGSGQIQGKLRREMRFLQGTSSSTVRFQASLF